MQRRYIILSVIISLCPFLVWTLDNGLARTPPMGWLPWERFRCNKDCKNDPENCISERLMKQTADAMVSGGFLSAGYNYLILDDCWMASERDAQGRLQSDPDRFPSGIKALADYVHSKGLKFGIYQDFGSKTCAGNPGSEYHLKMDAETFANWTVDYLKLDGCYSNPKDFDTGYRAMSSYLNKTGRPILFSCEWPLYQEGHLIVPNMTGVREICNLARNFVDIDDSWDSVLGIIEFYGIDLLGHSKYSGPGFWNDPDTLVIGDFGLSPGQERVQMAMWSIMASPLIMSSDLRNMRTSSRELLLNRNLIAINQDPAGVQGKRIFMKGDLDVWKRPLTPTGTCAVAFLYTGLGNPLRVEISAKSLGLDHPSGYNITEVFRGDHLGFLKPTDNFVCFVNPTDVFLIKAVPLSYN